MKKKRLSAYNIVKAKWIINRVRALKDNNCYSQELAESTAIYEWELLSKKEREDMVERYKDTFLI